MILMILKKCLHIMYFDNDYEKVIEEWKEFILGQNE